MSWCSNNEMGKGVRGEFNEAMTITIRSAIKPLHPFYQSHPPIVRESIAPIKLKFLAVFQRFTVTREGVGWQLRGELN